MAESGTGVESQCALHGNLKIVGDHLQLTESAKCTCTINLQQIQNQFTRTVNCVNKQEPRLDLFENQSIILNALNREARTNGLYQESGIRIVGFIVDFIDCHKDDNMQLRMALNVCYQFLTAPISTECVRTWKASIWRRLYEKLLELLFCGNISDNHIMAANVIIILKICIEHYEQKQICTVLWKRVMEAENDNSITPEMRAQIVMNFFDNFMNGNLNLSCDEKLASIVQRQLISEQREERKAAYYMLKKLNEISTTTTSSQPNTNDCADNTIANRWSIYITIMENLEENQSHLILPSLELLPIIECCFGDQPQPQQSNNWRSWLKILYQRLLSHNNILIIRYTLEHFLNANIPMQLCEEMLPQVLSAFNNTLLYNYEGYFIPMHNMTHFFHQHQHLLNRLADVNWKSVPLHFWLTQVKTNRHLFANEIDFDILLQIAKRIRNLQNRSLRKKSIALCKEIFAQNIENMCLKNYLTFITTLHNNKDHQSMKEILSKVAQRITNSDEIDEVLNFNEQFYEILYKSMKEDDNEDDNNSNCNYQIDNDLLKIMTFLEAAPLKSHGWLRFFIVFELPVAKSVALKNFCVNQYGLDVISLATETRLDRVVTELKNKLSICSEEKSMVGCCYDYFIYHNLTNLQQISDWTLLLETLTYKALYKLTQLIAAVDVTDNITVPLNQFLTSIKVFLKEGYNCYALILNLLKYCIKHLSSDKCQEYAEQCLLLDLDNASIHFSVLNSNVKLSTESYVRGMLLGEVKTGEPRVEYIYDIKMGNMKFAEVRHQYVFFIPQNQIEIALKLLKNEGLNIGRRKARYFENSDEHRLQMRIAYAFSMLTLRCKSLNISTLVELLQMENSHANVNIIYEFLISKIATYNDIYEMLTSVGHHTPSFAISAIVIAHAFCIFNVNHLSIQDNDKILNVLLPFTMGANFQIRLYAQLVIYNIIKRHWASYEQSWQHVYIAIRNVLGATAIKNQMDNIRLKLSDEEKYFHPHFLHSIVMYVTNAPIDEYLDFDNAGEEIFAKSKALYMKKKCNYIQSSSNTNSSFDTECNRDVAQNNVNYLQRKLNPSCDTLWQHDLTKLTSNIKNNCDANDLYVIASLIDKLPNLGGIARTCEVLGIQNLVFDTATSTSKTDFKNLSMTAEKGLNILEVRVSMLPKFLMQKQLEGFRIVGAEQTANSVSFVNFQFPRKTVLILGHEKEGIPPNLLQFLDYAVEIPQFGLVRSLNVHVTAALFIWEYSKQHIIKK